ncbi:MAG: hypothetical protein JXL97_02395 [Bacteroidales bacterium]|nr:hypothetical protein [Bacteroidales bacterium]
MVCEKTLGCPFYNDKMANMPNNTEELKQKFCLTDKTNCARYIVVTKFGGVPSDLFPDNFERAQEIVKNGGFYTEML